MAAFSLSGVRLSRLLDGQSGPPGVASVLTAFVRVFLLQLRFLDEFKDFETDKAHRPERPVPRGLLGLRSMGAGLAAVAVVQAALVLWPRPALMALVAMVRAYMVLMTAEFLVPRWIKPRLLTYMWTHMLIMPLIDFFASGCDRALRGDRPPGLRLFLAVSFLNGLMAEMGRKTWAPSRERPGADSNSSRLGLGRALFSAVMAASLAGAVGVARQVGFALPTLVVMGALFAWDLGLSARFARARTEGLAKRLELFSGLWVIAS